MSVISYGSDCSGIEAPYVALQQLLPKHRLQHKFASDINANVKLMIDANYGAEQWFDNSNVPAAEKPYVDIYTAGFPCQPFSTFGARRGFNDARGTVFYDCAEYIRTHRPKVFLLENVKGLKGHNGGDTFNTIMRILTEDIENYHVSWQILSPHQHCNWAQHRPRIFFIGLRNDIADAPLPQFEDVPLTHRAQLFLNTRVKGDPKTLKPYEIECLAAKKKRFMDNHNIDVDTEFYFADLGTSPVYGNIFRIPNVVPTLKAQRACFYITKLHRKMTTDEVRKVQGFPDSINVVVSEQQFQKQIGNSMCVPLLVHIFKAIFDYTGIAA